MRVVDCGSGAGFGDTRFGSQGLTVTPLASDAANVVLLRVAAGGRIGRHRAIGHQVFAVVAGSGRARSGAGDWVEVSAGRAVVWEPGEEHETVADTDLTVVVSEGPALEPLLPMASSARTRRGSAGSESSPAGIRRDESAGT